LPNPVRRDQYRAIRVFKTGYWPPGFARDKAAAAPAARQGDNAMLIPIAIIAVLVCAYALSFDKFSDAFRKTSHRDKAGS
jgi:hypothetical protein